jgi:hypothetical protein
MKGEFQIPSTKSQAKSNLPKKETPKENFFDFGVRELELVTYLEFDAWDLMSSHSAFRSLARPNFLLLNRRSLC